MAKLHATVLPSLSERALSRERSLERGSLEREPRGDKEGDAVGHLEPLCRNPLPSFFLLHLRCDDERGPARCGIESADATCRLGGPQRAVPLRARHSNGRWARLDMAVPHALNTFNAAVPCVPFELRPRRRTAASSVLSCGPVLFRGTATPKYASRCGR